MFVVRVQVAKLQTAISGGILRHSAGEHMVSRADVSLVVLFLVLVY